MILREHEQARIGPRWDEQARRLPESAVLRLLAYQRRSGQPLFQPVFRGLKATHWVGAIGVGRRTLEVVPKVDREGALAARGNLLHMVVASGLLPAREADIAWLADRRRPLVAAYLALYVAHLAREWRRGPVRRYVSVIENRRYLRGKLLLPENLRANLVHRERFFTAADELSADNPVARLLKAALVRCARQLFSATLAGRARGLLAELAEVADEPPGAAELETMVIDRTIARYEPLVAMARLILAATSPAEAGSAASPPVHSLMFDMNVVFERFIARRLRRTLAPLGFEVRTQIAGRTLVHRQGRGCFRLRPDVGIWRGGEIVCVVDTKWKRLDPALPRSGVGQDDMYQMYAYGKEFRCPRTVLLYPRHGELREIVAEYEHHGPAGSSGGNARIAVATVDVSAPLAAASRAALDRTLRAVTVGLAAPP